MPTEPTDEREASVSSSLKELLKLEDQRLEDQAREHAARVAAAARDREQAEQRRRETMAAAAQQQRRTDLDELARREAMQKAIVEQSRLEVEVRARAEERERERRHEIEIQRLRKAATGSSLGVLSAASALGGGAMLVVGLGIHLGVQKPAAEHRVAELEQSIAVAERRAEELAGQRDEYLRIVRERERQLADAESQINTLTTAPPSPPVPAKLRFAPSGSKTAAPKTADKETCLPGDPMCFSLKTGR